MRIAIISDIHANCVALDAILQDCSTEELDKIVCLGDLVTVGAPTAPGHRAPQ